MNRIGFTIRLKTGFAVCLTHDHPELLLSTSLALAAVCTLHLLVAGLLSERQPADYITVRRWEQKHDILHTELAHMTVPTRDVFPRQ